MRRTLKVITNKDEAPRSVHVGESGAVRKSEEELIRLASLHGDKEAFRELFEPYLPQLFSFIFNSVRNSQDAEDILQETMVRAFLNLRSFRQDSSIKTWAYKIASNLTIDFQRKRKIKTTSLNEIDGYNVEVVDRGSTPEELYSQAQDASAISKALGDLTPEHREVVVLREMEGQSYEEISRSLGLSVGTVMSRLHYARKSLQKSLKGLFNGGKKE